jgi:DNA replication protein DnaC
MFRLPRLAEKLALARTDGRYPKLMAALGRVKLLILDNWGLAPLDADTRRDLLEIVDDRHGRTATLITSQFAVDRWHDLIGEPTLADAILDRLVHNAHRIELKGGSMSKRRSDNVSP